ncbi:MAG: DUF58 domain-containing protein [Deltaproteobacteria bacterium]
MIPVLSAFRQRLRLPRGLRVTSPGKGFLALTLGVGAAAINTGNNLLYLAFSMNLSLIILSGLLSEGSIRGVRVEARPAAEAFAGRPSLLLLTVSAPASRRIPAFSLTVTPGAPAAGDPLRLPDIPRGGSVERIVPWLPSVRGPAPPVPCTLATRFPFGLFEKSRRVRAEAPSLLVYPEPLPPAGDPFRLPARHPEEGTVPVGRPGPFVGGARDLMPADPVREIHWKASAKTGRWMVKERESESDRAVEIRIPTDVPPDRFERLLSEGCGLVLALERENRPYRLRIGDRDTADAGRADRRKTALTRLALARRDPR